MPFTYLIIVPESIIVVATYHISSLISLLDNHTILRGHLPKVKLGEGE